MIQGSKINLASNSVVHRVQSKMIPKRNWFAKIKESFVGILMFMLFFGMFMLFFNTDYDMLTKRVQAFSDPDGYTTKTEQIPKAWLDRYAIAITTDADIDADQDGDGLTLRQEYVHLTDPISPDTDGDGVSDGQEVKDGQNPRGVGVLDVDGDQLPDTWEREMGTNPLVNDRDADPDEDGLSNILEFIHKLDPQNPDSDADTFPDGAEVRNGYDPSAPGEVKPETTIDISKIDVTVPMVWSQSIFEEQLQADLTRGAVHYPKTAAPGQGGNMFIAAHSSNYAWVEGNFNYVFSRLSEVNVGDALTIKTVQENGAAIDYVYRVTEQRIVQPEDPWIFQKTESATATFSTCWPLGTRQKRLIVKAELIR